MGIYIYIYICYPNNKYGYIYIYAYIYVAQKEKKIYIRKGFYRCIVLSPFVFVFFLVHHKNSNQRLFCPLACLVHVIFHLLLLCIPTIKDSLFHHPWRLDFFTFVKASLSFLFFTIK